MKVYGNVWTRKETRKYLKKYLKKKDLSKKLSILIVGATGFVGSNLLYFLSKYKYDLTAISKNSNLKITKKNISHIKLDVSKIKDLKKLKEYDIVINLSGYVDHKNKKKFMMFITKVQKI